MKSYHLILLIFFAFLSACKLTTPISPGELSQVHAHLEGTSNCTQCHVMGKKVSDNKCLDCHNYISDRIKGNKGYHASDEVSSKSCTSCHSDHHGRKFEIIHFDSIEFEHSITSYELEGAHNKTDCRSCHQRSHISDSLLKKRNNTYLGLDRDCRTCHDDYHQGTLTGDCKNCHDYTAFKPASGFNHTETAFPLKGAHVDVECDGCHPLTQLNKEPFQSFSGIEFNQCSSCHSDVHNGKFGTDCKSCHNELSFHSTGLSEGFDHDKTGFALKGKHVSVDCNDCHKSGNYTRGIPHNNCTDCHDDYHDGIFKNKQGRTDCLRCHDMNAFSQSSYNISSHEQAAFQLTGAHRLVECESCHLKNGKWNFRHIGKSCVDCHKDIHLGEISDKYYPGKDCESCHQTSVWTQIGFNHEQTGFTLLGAHAEQSCRACHFNNSFGIQGQKFMSLDESCIQCHEDIHSGQFAVEGYTECSKCHEFNDWQASLFNHNQADFKLDGKHENVACIKCHPIVQESGSTYIKYKLNSFRCEDCH